MACIFAENLNSVSNEKYVNMKKKTTRMRYIVTDKEDDIAYLITDIGGVSSIVNRSQNTIHNWFRNKKVFKSLDRYNIYKGMRTIKSNRRNLGNLRPKGGY